MELASDRRLIYPIWLSVRIRIRQQGGKELSETEPEIEDLIASVARALDLDIREHQKPGIVANFRNFLNLYHAVEGFEEPVAPDPLGIYAP